MMRRSLKWQILLTRLQANQQVIVKASKRKEFMKAKVAFASSLNIDNDLR